MVRCRICSFVYPSKNKSIGHFLNKWFDSSFYRRVCYLENGGLYLSVKLKNTFLNKLSSFVSKRKSCCMGCKKSITSDLIVGHYYDVDVVPASMRTRDIMDPF